MNLLQKLKMGAAELRVNAEFSAFPEVLRAKAQGIDKAIDIFVSHVNEYREPELNTGHDAVEVDVLLGVDFDREG